jgi:antitoxin (DNA-binding transcriptional repressor) of toxin-antitoxin stability system
MKPFTVSEFREHLAGVLDRVERGEAVVVSRRGRRFRIVAEPPRPSRAPVKAFFRVTDPQLLDTGWTWQWTAPGQPMRLRTPRRSKRTR